MLFKKRKSNQNKIKTPGKKREIITTIALSLILLFGKARQREGIAAAKKAGKYRGRKTVIDSKLIAKVKNLKEIKNLSITEIARLSEKSRATIYKVLKQELGYV